MGELSLDIVILTPETCQVRTVGQGDVVLAGSIRNLRDDGRSRHSEKNLPQCHSGHRESLTSA
jgi:hypothetical protein